MTRNSEHITHEDELDFDEFLQDLVKIRRILRVSWFISIGEALPLQSINAIKVDSSQ